MPLIWRRKKELYKIIKLCPQNSVTTHKGMNISELEFLAVVDDLLGAMDKNKLGDDVKNDVLSVLYSLKGEIIRI